MIAPASFDITGLLRELGRGARTSRALNREQARALFSAMLSGEIDDLRLGALLLAYRIKAETAGELAGMLDAAQAVLTPIAVPTGPAPVVIASYNGARRLPNLVPLLALSLAARGVPVLIHGEATDGYGRIATASVFAALGIHASDSPADAANALTHGHRHGDACDGQRIAFVPIEVLSPAMARLLALRERIGLRNSAHTIVKLLDPFVGRALRLVNYTHPPYRDALFELLTEHAPPAAPGVLLARGSEGEAAADPRRQVEIEWLADGRAQTLIEAARSDSVEPVPLPPIDAIATAHWTQQALAGEVAMPAPLQRQIDTVVALATSGVATHCGNSWMDGTEGLDALVGVG